MELFDAHHQWASRPADQRFWTLEEMWTRTKAYADSAREKLAPIGTIRTEAHDQDVVLVGKGNIPAKVTNYAFGQLARFAGAPAEYLQRLPPTLAAQNLNHGLARLSKESPSKQVNILAHQNGSLVIRALTGEKYDRVWNHEVIAAVRRNLGDDWRPPPARPSGNGSEIAGTRAATAEDCMGASRVRVGERIAPAGLYASDHDMFAFLVHRTLAVDDHAGGKLHIGQFIQNSEVGDCALKGKLFTFDEVCGNHIVWGARDVWEWSVRHVKGNSVSRTLQNARLKWGVSVRAALGSQLEIEQGIKAARNYEIAATKDEVLDAVFGFAKKKSLQTLSRTAIAEAYEIAEKTPRYGSPNTVWAMVNGLTEYSQTLGGFTDSRTDMDTQASKLLEMAF